jgi:hypothetical protein
MLNLLLASIPPSYVSDPPLAPALLKAAVESNGFTCQTVDFSLECFEQVFSKNYNAFNDWGKIFPDYFDWEKVTETQTALVNQATDLFLDLIAELSPEYVGISIFSIWHQRFAYFLCKKIKDSKSNVKIILGGMGCDTTPTGLTSVVALTSFDKMSSYAKFMLKSNLADFVVLNDGEIELVNILRDGKSHSTIPNEVSFNHTYYPNFDDYKLDNYFFFNNEKKLLIQGSKGCVRECVFCGEHDNYSKFFFKSGVDIAEEMISLSKKYNIYKFHFTDSLVNGSLKEFKQFTKKLAEYNQTHADKKIKWHGNYICRSKNTLTDDDFNLIKLSGAHGLTIGAESGSNRVLEEMKKQSTVEDLEYEISKFEKFNIDCNLLFLSGFYNETWNDFLETLQLFKRLHRYFYTGTISTIRCGYTLSITNWKHIDSRNFKYDPHNAYNWIYLPNPALTLNERVRRRVITQEFCDQLGIPIAFSREDLLVLDAIYNNNLTDIGKLNHGHN